MAARESKGRRVSDPGEFGGRPFGDIGQGSYSPVVLSINLGTRHWELGADV